MPFSLRLWHAAVVVATGIRNRERCEQMMGKHGLN